jgi:hypothetical protein
MMLLLLACVIIALIASVVLATGTVTEANFYNCRSRYIGDLDIISTAYKVGKSLEQSLSLTKASSRYVLGPLSAVLLLFIILHFPINNTFS